MTKGREHDFYKVSAAVDVVVFTLEDDALKVLTITRADNPYKSARALPGGFIRKGEDSMKTARRILRDKAGLTDIYIEQLYTFDKPQRDPRGRVVSIAYFALLPKPDLSIHLSRSTQKPVLVSVKSLGKLAFDHNTIVETARERLRGKFEYTNIAFSLLPEKFTFSELQSVYETIFGKSFDKRNFRKKILRLGFLKATREKVRSGRQRPALLYRASTSKKETFKNNF